MTISDLNPLHFWLVEPTAIADVTSVTEVIDLAAFGVTFNTKDRNGAAQDRIYFHILQNDDVLKIQIVVDDPDDTFKLSGRNQDGTLWENFDFALVSGNHFQLTIGLDDYPDAINTKKFFALVNDTDSEILAVTDHHSIKEDVKKSVLITYSNESAFDNILADTEMSFRVPGIFDEDANGELPEEVESDTLSDGTVVELTSSVKEQRELRVELVPKHIHKKIKMILKCSEKEIDGLNWKQEEPYEMEKPPYPTYTMRRGHGMLTLDGSIVRNVYST